MSIVEIVLFVLVISLIVSLFWMNSNVYKYRLFTGISVILVLMIHVIIDSIYWQGYPLYVAIVVLLVATLLPIVNYFEWKKWSRRIVLITSVVFLVVSFGSILAFPIYDLPTPTGTYPIGTTSMTLVDNSRFEQYGDDSSQYRQIQLQFWYPSDDVDGYEQVPWLEDGLVVSRALARDTGLPAFTLDHTVDILSHSYKDAPISDDLGQYPIIIISHGWRGFRNLHTDFAEELASQGYIVISIDHTFGSVATVFDDESVSLLNLDALPPREINDNFLVDANQLVETYGNDVIATLDHLEVLHNSTGSMFGGRLDLDSIGLLGHSTGGGGDAYVAINDPRIDAVFGLESWVEPIAEADLDKGITVPSMFLRSGAWQEGENNSYLYRLINASSDAVLYQIDGTTHYDFSMVYMYSPLTKYIGFTGEIEGRELNQLLTGLIVDFFQEHLLGDTTGITDPTSSEYVREIPVS
jgi:hypothetical protein